MVSGAVVRAFFGSVHAALHSTAFAIATEAVVALAALFWLGLAHWVYRDARRRVGDPWLVGLATLLALGLPYLGAVVYLLFRPPETLEDARARRIELRALEERLLRAVDQCPVCRVAIEPNYLVCPVCTTQLKQPCIRCSAPLDPLWQMCPYCAMPVTAAALEDLDAALTAEAMVNGNGKAAQRAADVP